MADTVHQTYRNVLQDIHSEHVRGIGLMPSIRDSYGGALYFPGRSHGDERKWVAGAALFGFLAGGIVVTLSFFVFTKQNRFPDMPTVIAAPASVESRAGELSSIQTEMELMKKILAGLVENVQTLAKPQKIEESRVSTTYFEETFPYPVKVNSDKAILRSGPNKDEKPLLVVAKDAVLLATESKMGWLKVSTPKGEEAWVSRDLVSEKKE